MKQGHHGGDVLAHTSKAGKGFIIGDDPSVHVMCRGACAPSISTAPDLLIDLLVLLNKLLSGFIYFPLSGLQLLHPYARWGHCSPFGSIAEVACGVTSSSEALSTCPSEVSATKHSREG